MVVFSYRISLAFIRLIVMSHPRPSRVSILTSVLLGLLFGLSSLSLAQDDLANVIEESEKSVLRIEVNGIEGGSLGNGLAKWLMQPGTQSLQISNQSTADEPGGATILDLPNISHTLPVDATKFFPGDMQMQYFYPNSSVGLDLNHVDLSNGTWGEVMGAQNHGTI